MDQQEEIAAQARFEVESKNKEAPAKPRRGRPRKKKDVE